MTIYYIILALVIILLILVSWILILAFIRGGTRQDEPKRDEYDIPPDLKKLHDKFVGRR